MIEKKFIEIRKRLEGLLKNNSQDIKLQIELSDKKSEGKKKREEKILLGHQEFSNGINLAYQQFCKEFGITYKPIKPNYSGY